MKVGGKLAAALAASTVALGLVATPAVAFSVRPAALQRAARAFCRPDNAILAKHRGPAIAYPRIVVSQISGTEFAVLAEYRAIHPAYVVLYDGKIVGDTWVTLTSTPEPTLHKIGKFADSCDLLKVGAK